MFIHVNAVAHDGDYRLRVEFDDRVVKVIDLEHELVGPVFEPLRDPAVFHQVAVNRDTGTIEWPNGADFAPEFLYEIGVAAEGTPTRRVAEARTPYGKKA